MLEGPEAEERGREKQVLKDSYKYVCVHVCLSLSVLKLLLEHDLLQTGTNQSMTLTLLTFLIVDTKTKT